ncbi:GTPase family protein [Mycolicibacterium celeriflavum]|uniref:ABC transporter n=1 Tax=Mycolicibacterium celeriflavum TaxID=1249101 RepID=A0A1X0BP11_MYCCF|nr:GTPase domain-containing protein [Mycolicibacterium celeriflavum]MCV7238762.1 GTPase domain-containing protein [Mycolicibacterium celeriflavum]ORA44830.1 ABC transporter [Mycolicibacterium celeriflavum]BBY46331.1 ABC transporter [Mycolicibacterium celeriflavum]
MTGDGELVDAVTGLAAALERTTFPLPTPSSWTAERDRRELTGQMADYLIPRLQSIDAPLLAVVGGSTGAGKSTLINSLVGAEVSAAGVLRPTTRGPVVVCHPSDLPWFANDRILPQLPRSSGPDGLRLAPHPGIGPGLALLDAPDIDSVVSTNRELAATLLAAADLWIFLTTAARYADAVPWQMLRTARDRGTAVAIVLNRCPPEALNDVSRHLSDMLAAGELSGAPLFVIAEQALRHGRLKDKAIAPIRSWLTGLTADAEQRAAVVRYTLDGALHSLSPRTYTLAAAADDQADVRSQLESCVSSAHDGALERVESAIRDGALLRGEVLARWQDVVGTGEFLRRLESRVGRIRDRMVAAVTGRSTPVEELGSALETGIAAVVVAAVEDAAEQSYGCWARHEAGARLLTDELARPAPGLAEAVERLVRDWEDFVLGLVRTEGASKRSSARLASYGVNGAGLVVMLAVFSQTGGLTGAEVGIAGGTSVASQKVLEAIFGEQAVRGLARQARDDLLARAGTLLARDADRYRHVLDSASPMVSGDELRRAADRVAAVLT